MTLWRKTTRYYSDEEDMRGLFKAFANRIDNEVINNQENGEALPYYMGAEILINLLLNHSDIRNQISLIGLFDETLRNEGIELQVDKFTE